MGKKIYVIVILILGIIGIVMIAKALNKDDGTKEEEVKGEIVAINSLDELFPNEEGKKNKYKSGDVEYKVRVTNIEEKDGVKKVTTQREEKAEDGDYIVEMTYEIQEEKIIESGKYIKAGEEVSTIYPLEILVDGLPYEGKTWKSVDGLITNTVTKMRDNKVTIEASRMQEGYGEANETKEVKEIRVFEVGKGLVEYRVEVE